MILPMKLSGSYRINPAKARNPAGSQAEHGAPIFAGFPLHHHGRRRDKRSPGDSPERALTSIEKLY
jgi:hypothetical protein